MSGRHAFGPNLRRLRIQRGVSLEQIAKVTKVSVDLWNGLEHNDFNRWPGGIFARAYVREYARLIGVDPEATVDEFCRWFSRGDRRVLRLMREHAEIVGHELEWAEQLPPAAGDADRRESGAPAAPVRQAPPSAFVNLFVRLRRTFGNRGPA
jgi:transcriptional regulator with XRE-family HTH domain